ncbi:hypothetical protein D3C76_1148430 [compost metagenome]
MDRVLCAKAQAHLLQVAQRRLQQASVAGQRVPHAERLAFAGGDGQGDVLQQAELGVQLADLERTRQAQAWPLPGRHAGDVLAIEVDLALVGENLAGNLRDQGRLAGTVGADDGVQFALGQFKAGAVGGFHRTESLVQITNRQLCAHGRTSTAALGLTATTFGLRCSRLSSNP